MIRNKQEIKLFLSLLKISPLCEIKIPIPGSRSLSERIGGEEERAVDKIEIKQNAAPFNLQRTGNTRDFPAIKSFYDSILFRSDIFADSETREDEEEEEEYQRKSGGKRGGR